MEKWLQRGASAACLMVLLSCGGGGGAGGSGSSNAAPAAPESAKSVPAEYLGAFKGSCEAADDVSVASSGNPVSTRSYLSIEKASGNVARISLRFDFHLDATCDASPVAYISFDDPGNRISFEGTQASDGRTVQRVKISLAAPSGGTPANGGRMLFGDAIPMSAPAEIFQAARPQDIWLMESDRLFQGTATEGADGYPAGLDFSSGDQRIDAVPPMIAACRSGHVTWGAEGCDASLQASASGTSTLVADILGPSNGSATYTCTAGSWNLQASSSCVAETTPPASSGCTASAVTWTVGALTCKGDLDGMAEGAQRLVGNRDTAVTGFAIYTCTGGTPVATTAYCDPAPPPPPPLTEPAQIAQAKNCLVCHAVSDPGQSIGGVSFQVIADRYRATPPASGVLENRVKSGSVGTFGTIPMPANPQITDDQLGIVIPWILNR